MIILRIISNHLWLVSPTFSFVYLSPAHINTPLAWEPDLDLPWMSWVVHAWVRRHWHC